MGVINFHFLGICTNFRKLSNAALPVLHRIVLIKADNITAPIGGQVIPPHYATMTLPFPQVTMMSLPGTHVSVTNPLNFGCTYDPSFERLPNLTDLMQGTLLGGPSFPAMLGANSDVAAAWFDFNAGAFSACSTDEGAATTRVTVETTGDPQVMVQAFPPLAYPPPDPVVLPMPSDSTIVVQNTAIAPNEMMNPEGKFHFYLNYLTAHNVPANPLLPVIDMVHCSHLPPLIVGPGCSNSNFP